MLVIKSFESQILTSNARWINSEDHLQTSLSKSNTSCSVHTKSKCAIEETPEMNEYKHLIGQFYLNYVLLVINSYGLQNALERSPVDIGHFFACAMACSLLVRDHLAPSGFMKYSPDSHFVQTSYAVLTLLKVFYLLRVSFLPSLTLCTSATTARILCIYRR
jgi:hypothetical protein